jgi:hypothetical protein
VGAGVGALFGAGVEAARQYRTTGRVGDLRSVAREGLRGALIGGLVGLGVPSVAPAAATTMETVVATGAGATIVTAHVSPMVDLATGGQVRSAGEYASEAARTGFGAATGNAMVAGGKTLPAAGSALDDASTMAMAGNIRGAQSALASGVPPATAGSVTAENAIANLTTTAITPEPRTCIKLDGANGC